MAIEDHWARGRVLPVLIFGFLAATAHAQTVTPVLPAQFESHLTSQLTLTHHANLTQTIGGQTAKKGSNGWLVVGGTLTFPTSAAEFARKLTSQFADPFTQLSRSRIWHDVVTPEQTSRYRREVDWLRIRHLAGL